MPARQLSLFETLSLIFIAEGMVGWSALASHGWLVPISCVLAWWLLALAAIDIRFLLLPDVLTLPLAVVGLLVTLFGDSGQIADHLLAAGVGYATFVAVRVAYFRWRRIEGLGLGDAKLMAALGAWLGTAGLPSVVLIAATGGLIFVLVERLAGRPLSSERPLPFGAYLCLGAWLVWLYGPLQLA
jgi:leader peptidase (prepilin peptidase)/N-methyltransferase